MADKRQVPAVEGLFTWPSDEPRLIGAKCESCGTFFFPSFAQFHKPGCDGGPVKEVLLSNRGKLVSYTIEYYPPPPPFVRPDPFVPFAVGTVSLPEGIQIPGQMTGIAFEDLRTNIDVEIVVEKLYENEDGSDALTWKFRPVKS